MKTNSKPEIPRIDGKPFFQQLCAEGLTHQYRASLIKKGPHGRRRNDAPARAWLMPLEEVLPEFTGHEIDQTCKRNIQARIIPVIFMTAMHNGTNKLQRFSLSGLDAHLQSLLTAIPDTNDSMVLWHFCNGLLPKEHVADVFQESSRNHFTLVMWVIFVANHNFHEPAKNQYGDD